MIQAIFFVAYAILLLLFVIFVGVCHLRISARLKGNHAIITQLFPVFITVFMILIKFLLANTVFINLPRYITLLPGLFILLTKKL